MPFDDAEQLERLAFGVRLSPERVARIIVSALGIALVLWLSRPKGEGLPNSRATDSAGLAASTHLPGTAGTAPPAAHSSELPALTERALALGWKGAAETNFDARRLASEHTLSVRFMAAYEASFRGVLVTDATGSYRLGLAPYSALGSPAIEVAVGGTIFTHPLDDPLLTDNDFRRGPPRQPRRKWRQLAITRLGMHINVFLDGAPVGAFTAARDAPAGSLRFGRLLTPGEVQDQFYGFIDDVALFERALSPRDVRALATKVRLEGDEPGLIAGWFFNESASEARFAKGGAAPTPPSSAGSDVGPAVRRELPYRLLGSASVSEVSLARDNASDDDRLPTPRHDTRFSLPFAEGQVWMLIQGVNSRLSHHDVAAFALDFLRVEPGLVARNPARLPGGSHAASAGAPFVAVADGTVVSRVDCFPNDNRGGCPGRAAARTSPRAAPGDPANRNLLCLEHARGEVSCVLHLRNASIRVARGARVLRASELGEVGKTGAQSVHLHFALSDRPEPNEPGTFSALTTFPVAFSNYNISNDFGASWQHVVEGVPSPGQWLRRAPEPPH